MAAAKNDVDAAGGAAFSALRPTVGRVLLAYGALWDGPRPAVCVHATDPKEDLHPNSTRVNVFFDGSRDPEMVARVRERPSGNTFIHVPVFDALTAGQRAAAVAQSSEGVIVEWPPRG